MLASTFKNTPTYLNCNVSLKVDKQLEQDLQATRFYHDTNDESEHDDEDGDGYVVDPEEVLRKYQEQYDHNQQKNKTILAPETIKITSKNHEHDKRRVVRNAQAPLSFEWFKDDEKVDTSKSEESYTLFPNGTLRFQGSNLTAGEYRCHAKYSDDSRKFTIGPIISQATVVQIASEFHKYFPSKKLRTFLF